MDRQDLKEGQEVYVKGRVIHTGDHLDIVLDKGSFIENAIILHHEKPVIPQFVAKWIDYCKFTHVDLQHALVVGDVYFYNYANQKDFSKLKEFLETENNQATFARAWLFGYDVEQEKRYRIKMKNGDDYLVKTNNDDYHFYNNIYIQNRKHTREELEDAGFGWVFDCEGIEIEEVQDDTEI